MFFSGNPSICLTSQLQNTFHYKHTFTFPFSFKRSFFIHSFPLPIETKQGTPPNIFLSRFRYSSGGYTSEDFFSSLPRPLITLRASSLNLVTMSRYLLSTASYSRICLECSLSNLIRASISARFRSWAKSLRRSLSVLMKIILYEEAING